MQRYIFLTDKRQTSYDDDFNTTSHTSITEELQVGLVFVSNLFMLKGDIHFDHSHEAFLQYVSIF